MHAFLSRERHDRSGFTQVGGTDQHVIQHGTYQSEYALIRYGVAPYAHGRRVLIELHYSDRI